VLALSLASSTALGLSHAATASPDEPLAVPAPVSAPVPVPGARGEVAASSVGLDELEALAPARRERAASPATSATERDLRAAYLRRARSEPGSLERLAAGVLASDGAKSEKVALLLTLDDVRSPETVAWLEHAAKSLPDASNAEGESVPSFAIRRLSRRAADDSAATAALGRLAFESSDLAPELRRRAAAGYAARCPAAEIAALAPRLSRERDELVIAGVLAALEARERDPAARRLLDRFDRPAADATFAYDGAGEP
jgi:hypothetical protein